MTIFYYYDIMNAHPHEEELRQLRAENEQLKLKYKKSLQELMHIIQVNKTLKESTSNASSH